MPFRQLLKSPYQYFKNRNGIFCKLELNLRWEQWSNIFIWQLFQNLPKIKYFLAYVNRSIGLTIKIILSVQDNFCRTFAIVRRTFGMTVSHLYNLLIIYNWDTEGITCLYFLLFCNIVELVFILNMREIFATGR